MHIAWVYDNNLRQKKIKKILFFKHITYCDCSICFKLPVELLSSGIACSMNVSTRFLSNYFISDVQSTLVGCMSRELADAQLCFLQGCMPAIVYISRKSLLFFRLCFVVIQ